MKLNTSIEDLTSGLPPTFKLFLNYCRKLKFESDPDYNHIKKLFKDLLANRHQSIDDKYDWFYKKLSVQIPIKDYYDYEQQKAIREKME